MAVSSSFLEYVLEQLSESRLDIAHKRMFGGIGIYADERFVAVIDNDRLFLKVGDANRGDYEREGCEAFQPYGDGTYSMSYFEPPTRVLEDRHELARWLDKSFDVAGEKKKMKKTTARRPKRAL